MKRFIHPFMQLLVLAALSLAFFVVSVALGMVLEVPSGCEPGTAGSFLLWNACAQVLMFALPPVFVASMYFRGGIRGYLRLDFSGRRWFFAFVGVVVLLLLVPLTDWLAVWNDGWHWTGICENVENELRRIGEESQHTVELVLNECHPLLSLVCVALVPAVCEELFFRAGIQNLLMRWCKNVHVAVWVTAAIFSLAHGEVFAFLPRFLLGALLGYLFAYGGSLIVNVMVHFVNNAMVVLLFCFFAPTSGFNPTEPLGVDWIVTLACSVAAGTLLLVTFGKELKISK